MNVFLVYVLFMFIESVFFLLFDLDLSLLTTVPFQGRRNKFTYMSSLTRMHGWKIGK